MSVVNQIDKVTRTLSDKAMGLIGKRKVRANTLKCVFLFPSSNLETVDLEIESQSVSWKGGKGTMKYGIAPKGIIRHENIAYGFWFYNNPNMIIFDYSSQSFGVDSETFDLLQDTKVIRDAISADVGEHDTLILIATVVSAMASVLILLKIFGFIGK